jgi:hypothetical protein
MPPCKMIDIGYGNAITAILTPLSREPMLGAVSPRLLSVLVISPRTVGAIESP